MVPPSSNINVNNKVTQVYSANAGIHIGFLVSPFSCITQVPLFFDKIVVRHIVISFDKIRKVIVYSNVQILVLKSVSP